MSEGGSGNLFFNELQEQIVLLLNKIQEEDEGKAVEWNEGGVERECWMLWHCTLDKRLQLFGRFQNHQVKEQQQEQRELEREREQEQQSIAVGVKTLEDMIYVLYNDFLDVNKRLVWGKSAWWLWRALTEMSSVVQRLKPIPSDEEVLTFKPTEQQQQQPSLKVMSGSLWLAKVQDRIQDRLDICKVLGISDGRRAGALPAPPNHGEGMDGDKQGQRWSELRRALLMTGVGEDEVGGKMVNWAGNAGSDPRSCGLLFPMKRTGLRVVSEEGSAGVIDRMLEWMKAGQLRQELATLGSAWILCFGAGVDEITRWLTELQRGKGGMLVLAGCLAWVGKDERVLADVWRRAHDEGGWVWNVLVQTLGIRGCCDSQLWDHVLEGMGTEEARRALRSGENAHVLAAVVGSRVESGGVFVSNGWEAAGRIWTGLSSALDERLKMKFSDAVYMSGLAALSDVVTWSLDSVHRAVCLVLWIGAGEGSWNGLTSAWSSQPRLCHGWGLEARRRLGISDQELAGAWALELAGEGVEVEGRRRVIVDVLPGLEEGPEVIALRRSLSSVGVGDVGGSNKRVLSRVTSAPQRSFRGAVRGVVPRPPSVVVVDDDDGEFGATRGVVAKTRQVRGSVGRLSVPARPLALRSTRAAGKEEGPARAGVVTTEPRRGLPPVGGGLGRGGKKRTSIVTGNVLPGLKGIDGVGGLAGGD